ncbi:hypothetical protein BOTBODRAFT_177999 [Botryobasidium botryosum FD-172 SS1]|uniref:Carboxylesterase type B domain-containing protein n=1 Tax=Botryobasidium botryosum (strain FD-172 SS1) TaxID=930990 RepID=A0A067MFQ5_BOTB1|nr:hypothetical protein BOTBODRAFT_177999 [Botryobasidium botryosum FD-172 SS1]
MGLLGEGEESSTPFTHARLGELTYLADDDVAQFFVPYASVPGRYRQSALLDASFGRRDCTKPGPVCPQMRDMSEHFGPAIDKSMVKVFGYLPTRWEIEYDELECLNLTVAAPRPALGSNSLRPVIVYIHGGGNSVGSGGHCGKTDPANLVRLSIQENNEVVVVAIDYRLHFLGFLASQDLVEYNAAHGEPPCNYGVHDVRNALLWVKKNIAAFGGDPDQVTAVGESAGSMMIGQQMCSTVPNLFRRAILMSSPPAGLRPYTLDAHDARYRGLLQRLNIPYDSLSPQQRVQALIDVPVGKFNDVLIEGRPENPLFHCLQHPSFFPVPLTEESQYELIAKCDWVDELIVGDMAFEGIIFSGLVTPPSGTYDTFHTLFTDTYGSASTTDKVFAAYHITPDLPPPDFTRAAAILIGDIMITRGQGHLVRYLTSPPPGVPKSKRVYFYHMEHPSPLRDSPLCGTPHHQLDVVFLFQNFNSTWSDPADVRTAVEMGRRWVAFACGRAPWAAYESEVKIAAVLLNGVSEVPRDADQNTRYAAMDLLTELGVSNTKFASHVELTLQPTSK